MKQESKKQFWNDLEKSLVGIGIIISMWVVSIIYTLGLGVIVVGGFLSGYILASLLIASYFVLLWSAFMLPYWKAYSEYLYGKKKEVKNNGKTK